MFYLKYKSRMSLIIPLPAEYASGQNKDYLKTIAMPFYMLFSLLGTSENSLMA